MTADTEPDYDVIVVGAGMGGLYGVKRFREQGLRVLGLEAAPDVGGVWYQNGYPGARVDVESLYYCYCFDPELYRSWRWSERLATQPEILAYYQHVANRYDLRRDIRFNHRVTGGVWDPTTQIWRVSVGSAQFSARYLVMATGQLSKPKAPPYEGLSDFRGEWVLTSAWRPVALDGKRVAVMGTGSSGVQAVSAISTMAAHLHVLQRTPSYVVPVKNGPLDPGELEAVADSLDEMWNEMTRSPVGLPGLPERLGSVWDFSPRKRQRIMEERWQQRPFNVFTAFTDYAIDAAANEVLADFVRHKASVLIEDPALREKLLNRQYPIGARRIVFASGYYESFNRDNVTLVDIAEDPLDRFTHTGVRLRSGREIEIDTMVFALGFEAFTGAVDDAGIRNERGARPFDRWTRGPRTLLGLMTRDFPNLFFPTGPGGPSTLSSNMNLTNVHDINYISGLIAHAQATGATRIEPAEDAIEAWTAHVQDVAKNHLRLQDDNYMVQVLDDGTRILIPYIGGVGEYIRRAAVIAENNYDGFEFT